MTTKFKQLAKDYWLSVVMVGTLLFVLVGVGMQIPDAIEATKERTVAIGDTATTTATTTEPVVTYQRYDEYYTNESRIIRYVARMETYKDTPEWKDDKYVKKVLDSTKDINVDAMRQHFIDRNIMTGAEFDTAFQNVVDLGHISLQNKKVKAKNSIYTAYDDLVAQRAIVEGL